MGVASTLSRSIRRAILEKIIVKPLGVAFCAPSDGVGVNVMASGTYEPDTINALKEIAKGDVMLDIGANIGTHSIALHHQFKRVLAFEPNRALSLVIEANTIVAGANNIETFAVGLSNKNEVSKLCFPEGNFSWGNVGGRPDWPSIEIKLANGDAFLASTLKENERVSFIKIDVEGHEISVLKGLSKVIQRDMPTIAYECLSTEEAAKIYGFLSSLGYSNFSAMTETPKGSILIKIFWLMRSGIYRLVPADASTTSHCCVAQY